MHLDGQAIFWLVPIAVFVFKCLVEALPTVLPSDPRWYGFLYRFFHAICLNLRVAGDSPWLAPDKNPLLGWEKQAELTSKITLKKD